jgi:hypothetical protein
MTRGAAFVLLIAAVPFAVVAALIGQTTRPGYVVPRTPWGDPDLQGVWPSTEYVSVPLQRPPQFGTRNQLTDDELAARARDIARQKEGFERDGAGGPTGAPGHWIEWGKTQRQVSLLVDPPDGRMPAMTPDAQKRLAAAPTGTFGTKPLNSPLDFTAWERCTSRGVLGSTLPVLYNSGIDITQGPGYIGIRYEMVHDHRVIPIDPSGERRPAVSAAITSYMGAARAHWDGDALVVVTANFNGKVGPGISGGGVPNTPDMTLTERFTRTSADTIQYVATVNDPKTWTAPWTVSFPLRLTPEYGMFEYACHEGNNGLRNALSAARAEERAAR